MIHIIWADSDNGSTVALQASGRGSIPRRSTKLRLVHIMAIIADCLSVDGSSILPRVAKFVFPDN